MKKAFFWRLIALSSSFGVSYIFYQYFFKSLIFTIVLNVVNHLLYLGFEKLWYNYMKWKYPVGTNVSCSENPITPYNEDILKLHGLKKKGFYYLGSIYTYWEKES